MLYTRYSGSVFDALLVIADVATARSVDQALKEKHYRRGLRCLRAWSECLLFQLDILHNSGSSVEKERNHEELMDLNKVNDLITGIFAPDMSDMAEYWKDFYLLLSCFYLFMLIMIPIHFKI